jgi:hypothetical protein
MRRWLVFLFACLLAAFARPEPSAAGWSAGGLFLPLGHGARAHALGSGVALLRDDAAVYWNPANLGWSEGQGLTLMVAEIFPGVGDGYQTLSYGRRSSTLLGGEEQKLRPARWGYGLFYSRLGLDFDTSSWSENTARLAGSMALANYASVGMAVKILWLDSGFESGGAFGAGLDIGLSALVTERLFAALVGRDLFTRVHFDTDTYQSQAAELDLGAEYRLRPAWSLLGETAFREGGLRRANAGVEARFHDDVLALRAGWTALYTGETRSLPSAGLGVRWDRFQLDYGVSFDGDDALGTKQRLSLHVGL